MNKKSAAGLVKALLETYKGDSGTNFIEVSNLPFQQKVIEILDMLREVLFPGYTGSRKVTASNLEFIIGDLICKVDDELTEQVERAFRHACRIKKCEDCDCRLKAENAVFSLLQKLPRIREILKTDVAAAYDGDPAAKSHEEVVLSYPGIAAVAIYRIAHELHLQDVPLIPRMMSEWAHRLTGIDIHPGATIGERFFIDHGTGVVIGETAVIGRNVRIYQGVTLGALRFKTDKHGRLIKGGKRHPTVEDDVVVSAEATILGDVTIGKGAVIGSNTWVQENVPAGVIVKMQNPDLRMSGRRTVPNNLKDAKP
ncbi:MAG TPA: serine O-acetyltransferase EpsC [Sedimentisphaerales bacterium]|nr:serine O-acetyltransferase EpsC [Sedimentisphaerales bacterium]